MDSEQIKAVKRMQGFIEAHRTEPITLTGLGREKEGITFVEAIQNVLKAIAGATGTAIVGAGNLIGDAGKAMGAGALAVGEGTVDAGKAVVDGAAGALQAINPFSKKE